MHFRAFSTESNQTTKTALSSLNSAHKTDTWLKVLNLPSIQAMHTSHRSDKAKMEPSKSLEGVSLASAFNELFFLFDTMMKSGITWAYKTGGTLDLLRLLKPWLISPLVNWPYSAPRLNGQRLSSHFLAVKAGWPIIRANLM